MESVPPFVRSLHLRNYRSVEACDIRFAPLTFLVGPNGSGKSNVLDGLRFIADALRASLDHAIRDRGGIAEVRRRSGGHPTHFAIRVDLEVGGTGRCHYGFRIGARPNAAFEVQNEECSIEGESGIARFAVRSGRLTGTGLGVDAALLPPASADRLYLLTASALPQFRAVYDSLANMGFYNLNPDRIRDLQSPDPGALLARDGSNLASVLARLAQYDPAAKRRIEEYLAYVVPGVTRVDRIVHGPKETIEFRQDIPGAKYPWSFGAQAMSDGTLRALAIECVGPSTHKGQPEESPP